MNIEQFVVRYKFRPTVAARIRRLNPNGVPEGNYVYGYHPHSRGMDWMRDAVSRGYIIRKYGRSALAALTSEGNGKRGCYSGRQLMERGFR